MKSTLPSPEFVMASLYRDEANHDYRVCNVMAESGPRWLDSASHIAVDPIYEGTLLKTYIKEKTSPGFDPSTWSRILEEAKTPQVLPGPNDLVVHLRLGDIFLPDLKGCSRHDMEMVPKGKLSKLIAHLKPDKVWLVAAMNWSPYRSGEKPEGYPDFAKDKFSLVQSLNTVRSFLEELPDGVPFDVFSEHPDQDLLFMRHAKHLVISPTSFSLMARHGLTKEERGTIYLMNPKWSKYIQRAKLNYQPNIRPV